MQQLWSAEAPDFDSENAQLLRIVDAISKATDKRGIDVLDRGGDRSELYKPLLSRGLRFIIRLVGNRNLRVRGQTRLASDIARGVRMCYAETLVKESAGGEKKVHIEYGFRRVRLPARRDVELTLVVIKGFGEEPLLLLTNVEVKKSRASLWQIVGGYLTRWLVEETIRFIKQSYRLEDLRVLDYQRLKAESARRSCKPRSAGAGGGVFRGGVAGRVVEVGGAAQPRDRDRETFFRRPRISLLRLGRRAARFSFKTGTMVSALPPKTDCHRKPTNLAFPIFLKNWGKSNKSVLDNFSVGATMPPASERRE